MNRIEMNQGMNGPQSAYRGRRRSLTASLLGLLLSLTVLTSRSNADGVVHFLYFYDHNCGVCAEVHDEVLEPLLAEYGDHILVVGRDIALADNFQMLIGLEQQHHLSAVGIPEIFIGDDVLVGPDEVRASLRERIDHYLAQGGVPLPKAPIPVPSPSAGVTAECDECGDIHQFERDARATRAAVSTDTPHTERAAIHAAFFFQHGCDECERSELDLRYLEAKFPQLVVHHFDVQENALLNQYLCTKVGAPEDKHLTAPALFVGDTYLIGNSVRGASIQALIEPYLSAGSAEPWAGWDGQQGSVQSSIIERFQSFGLITVIGAGLLDGVNPCAFATIIFLISYLAVRKRSGRELLLTGVSFAGGVFLTYLGVGLGFLKFLASLPFLNVIGKWVYRLTLVLCLVLAWGSYSDYRKAREGRLKDMTLKLPDRMRGWIRRLIREGSSSRNFILSSFGVGLGVSLVELACTGQVYLPTIIFVLGIPEWRSQATLALLLYNVMFILPLILIFGVVYFGTTSQQLIQWMSAHAGGVKLGTAVLFLLLAGWLGYSIIFL